MGNILRPAVFLDRDGTINVDKGYLYRKVDFEYMDGAVEGLKKLYRMGYLLFIITNQSGIARGYYTEEAFLSLNEWMLNDLCSKGIIVSEVYYCPHYIEGIVPQYSRACDCRKPGTHLFWKAKGEWGIDMGRSFAVGDKRRDISICNESGVTGILLGNTEKKEFNEGVVLCKDLMEAANYIGVYGNL